MEIYLVPFSILELVLLSPLYAFIAWFSFCKIRMKKIRYTGFLSWSYIIHAAVIPFFWMMHYWGIFRGVEANNEQFDPVEITGHIASFFLVYFLFTAILVTAGLLTVKWKSES